MGDGFFVGEVRVDQAGFERLAGRLLFGEGAAGEGMGLTLLVELVFELGDPLLQLAVVAGVEDGDGDAAILDEAVAGAGLFGPLLRRLDGAFWW